MRELAAVAWGELAARQLGPHWLGRAWEHDAHSLVLLSDSTGDALRLVEASDTLGPLDVVVPGLAEVVPIHLPLSYCWRIGSALWLGDEVTVHLPGNAPLATHLLWHQAMESLDAEAVARHLARLADWFLARAPEATVGGVLAERLGDGRARLPVRRDLPGHERLVRWRAARALDRLLPALDCGAMDGVESSIMMLAALGSGLPPTGLQFVLGLVGGLQLWPLFLNASSGLNEGPVIRRLLNAAGVHASQIGRAWIRAAQMDHWGQPWHRLVGHLGARGPYADWAYEQSQTIASEWLDSAPQEASAALAGMLLPFLLYQRQEMASDAG